VGEVVSHIKVGYPFFLILLCIVCAFQTQTSDQDTWDLYSLCSYVS
jgi:hypothetical protein